jgi:hypothetical protein
MADVKERTVDVLRKLDRSELFIETAVVARTGAVALCRIPKLMPRTHLIAYAILLPSLQP